MGKNAKAKFPRYASEYTYIRQITTTRTRKMQDRQTVDKYS